MIMSSGATLSFEVMPSFLQKFISLFPLTQGIQLMKSTFLGLQLVNPYLSIGIMLSVTIGCIIISLIFFKWE